MSIWDDFGFDLTLGEPSERPLELTPEVRAELNARLDDIDAARAHAIVSAQSYMVWR